MSSILDALKKSERQRNLGRDLIFRNTAPDSPTRPTWLLSAVLGGLLLLVLIIAVLVFSRQEAPGEGVTTLPSATVAKPELNAPAPVAPALRAETAQDLLDQARAARPAAARKAATAAEAIPGVEESGQPPWLSSLPEAFLSSLPPLEVNIHVYSPQESQRIVYINNRQVQQGERIQAGVMVEEVVHDGVVLRFRGQRFKLPRPS